MSDDLRDRCNACFALDVRDGACATCGADQAEPNRDRRALPVWTVVGGRYRVGVVLGSGGFGITYLAQDMQLARRAALKEFFPAGLAMRMGDRTAITCNSCGDEPPFERGLQRFFREGQILAKFAHPNIVRVYEVFQANGTAYLAMEFLDGMTLRGWLSSIGRLEVKQALDVMTFIVDALKAVHAANVVHRDLKPDNIYVTREGRMLLLDFGGAKQLTAEGDKSMDAMFAHGYAAPEQYFADSGKVGPWTDVYACGATLYKLLTGRTMRGAMERHGEDPPLDWSGSDAPLALRQAVAKAVSLQQGSRYPTIVDFANGLSAAAPPPPVPPPSAASEGGTAAPEPAVRLDPKSQRPLRLILSAGALTACVVAVFAWRLLSAPTIALPTPNPGPASASSPVPSLPSQAAAVSVREPARQPGGPDDAIKAQLNRMVEGASAADWKAVDAAARSIATAAKTGAAASAPSAALASAEALIQNGDYKTAAVSLRIATSAQPQDWQAWSALGYALLRQGQAADARVALTNSLRIRPEDASAWAHLGEVFASEGDVPNATSALRLAVFYSSQRAHTLEHLRTSTLIAPKFQDVIRSQGNKLDSLPERKT